VEELLIQQSLALLLVRACYFVAALHISQKKKKQHTSVNINANQYDLTLAMLSAGMYGKGSIRIDMDAATYDYLLLHRCR
jgi:hypothetical protein